LLQNSLLFDGDELKRKHSFENLLLIFTHSYVFRYLPQNIIILEFLQKRLFLFLVFGPLDRYELVLVAFPKNRMLENHSVFVKFVLLKVVQM